MRIRHNESSAHLKRGFFKTLRSRRWPSVKGRRIEPLCQADTHELTLGVWKFLYPGVVPLRYKYGVVDVYELYIIVIALCSVMYFITSLRFGDSLTRQA
ncbi:hypothetical protein Leryth_019266 [Lithospermum erythrorhizon]|nr:hypothetical protein Leryth_019266 [Lithospermum erythrorhizon]